MNTPSPARRAARCRLTGDALELCDEGELRYQAADRSDAAGFPTQADQQRRIAGRTVEVHLAEQALRQRDETT